MLGTTFLFLVVSRVGLETTLLVSSHFISQTLASTQYILLLHPDQTTALCTNSYKFHGGANHRPRDFLIVFT